MEDETMNFTLQWERELIDILNETENVRKCVVHNKEIEAFCFEDYKLLCIDCILEDGYQKRNISSLKKATEQHSDTLKSSVLKAQKIEQELGSTKVKIEKYQKDTERDFKEITNTVDSLYDTLIQQLLKNKQKMIERIKKINDEEQSKCIQAINNINLQVGAHFVIFM